MKLYIGCYTEKLSEELVGKGQGIYILDFDPADGSIRYVDCVEANNPSYLTISPDGKFLFALEEKPVERKPKIRAFSISGAGNGRLLSFISEGEMPGSFACHLTLSKSGDYLIVGAYMSGNILIYPVTEEGHIKPFIHEVVHEGNGPNKLRQEEPHVHFIYAGEKDQFFAVDLGIDKVKAYRFTSDSIREQPEAHMPVHPGSGPRHMVISQEGNHAFVFGELDAKIHCFKKNGQRFEFLESVATLPSDFRGVPSGAAIRMHPNGRFIYVSNRGYNAIAAFHFDEEKEKLSLIGHVPSGGKTPRDMNIDPNGNWLVCANQDSDNLVVFRINQQSGQLSQTGSSEAIKSPSCVLFGE